MSKGVTLVTRLLLMPHRSEQEDNCFTHISDYEKAQELADRFVKLKWGSKLNAFARRVNPLLKTELRRMECYGCADQANHACLDTLASLDQGKPDE